MLTDRPDLLDLAIDFAQVDAEIVAAEQYRDLIAASTQAMAKIAGNGPISAELADTIERTIRRFDKICGRPILIEVTAPEPHHRAAGALQAGERAYEHARDLIREIADRWEAPLLALGLALAVERQAETPLVRRFELAAMIAGIGLDDADQIKVVRAFQRFALGQPIDGSLAAPTAHSPSS